MPTDPHTIGRYEVVDRIGRGGMGVVYRARDPRIGRPVAIKLLSVQDDALRDRFHQEAQSVGNLAHRNIVTIFDFGEYEGQSYIVMEFVEGVTLADQIHDSVPIPLERKLEIVEELAAGLDYAHNKGIVHRDIKPANVMTDRDGVVKILDFGIARVGNINMTQAGMMLGTPNYMSPEQFESGHVDRRSDIFSVGALFYELLTYRKAFSGEQIWDVMKAVLTKTPERVGRFDPGIEPAIEAVVVRALEKEPAKRFQTLAEMTAALATAKAGLAARLASQKSATVLPSPDVAPRTPRPSTDRELIAKRRAERIEALLKDAQRAFDAGEYGSAVEACDQAILIDPDDSRVHALLDRSRRALDHQQAVDLLTDARAPLERGDLEQAAALVDQALQFDPAFVEARDLKGAIDDRIRQRNAEHRKRQEEQEAAEAAVKEQRTRFAAGHWLDAIGALERYTPRLEVIAAAIADLRTELAEIDRRTREEDERQKREQAEAQQQWVARQLELAKRAIAAQQFVGAIEILEHIQSISPNPPGLAEVLRQAQQGKSAAQDAARRKEAIAGILARVAAEVDRGRLVEARSLVASALSIDPAHPEALDRLREIKNAIDAQERRRQEAAREAEPVRRVQDAAQAGPVAELPVIPTSVSGGFTAPLPAARDSAAQGSVLFQKARRLFSGVTPPFDRVTPRAAGIAAGALVLVLAAVYVGFIREPIADTNSDARTSAPPATPTASAPTPPRTSERPSPAPPEPEPKPPAPDPLVQIRQRIQTALGSGDDRSALDALTEGFRIAPGDADFSRTLRDLNRRAQSTATSARQQAVIADAPKHASVEFDQGIARFDEGVRLRSSQPAAVRKFWEAAALFGKAKSSADAARKTTPSAPAPEPQQLPPSPPPQRPATDPEPPRPQQPPAPTVPDPEAAARQTLARQQALDREAIDQVLDRYVSAYNALDARAAARLVPGLNANELANTFSLYRSLRVGLMDKQVTLQGDTATVTCMRQVEVVLKRGGQTQNVRSPTTFRLRRSGASWVIENLTISPVGR